MDVLEAVGMLGDGRSDGGVSVSAGSTGFWIVIALILALIVLYRSMRKQISRVKFDESGTTDEERMSGRDQNAS